VAHAVWPRRAEVFAGLADVFASPERADAVLARMPVAERPVYRHSIVPGGVDSTSDVAGAIQRDAVVAAHYADIDVSTLHRKTVAAARAVYVSYRIGDRVFWTKHRVRLASGETLLTDGRSEIRTRCGNLVSDHARQPVADVEPPLATLDETQPDTGSSTIAGARVPDGDFHHGPDVPVVATGFPFGGADSPAGASGVLGAPMGAGEGGGGAPFLRSSTRPRGNPQPSPGDSDRAKGGTNGGGGSSDDDPSNGGGPNGGGSNGRGSSGDGGGASDAHPPFDHPTTTNEVVEPTTGSPEDTTGGGDADTTGGVSETTGDITGDAPSVPEPGTMALLTLAAIGLAARRFRSGR
jgi:hypothetical protein